MSDEETQVRISVANRLENIDLIQVVVLEALTRLGLDEDSGHQMEIAIREAVANAIIHGNRRDPEEEVTVELATAGDQAIIRVHDRGKGFDPAEVEDPRAPENLLKGSGRGILFMRSFVDEVEYTAGPEGGTVLTLRKRLGGSG